MKTIFSMNSWKVPWIDKKISVHIVSGDKNQNKDLGLDLNKFRKLINR